VGELETSVIVGPSGPADPSEMSVVLANSIQTGVAPPPQVRISRGADVRTEPLSPLGPHVQTGTRRDVRISQFPPNRGGSRWTELLRSEGPTVQTMVSVVEDGTLMADRRPNSRIRLGDVHTGLSKMIVASARLKRTEFFWSYLRCRCRGTKKNS
jgi:hypothetical protein